MKLRQIGAALTGVMLAASLVACGGGQSQSSGSASSGSGSSGAKTYTIATDTTFAPFEFADESNSYVGIDIELLDAIAKDQGFEYKLDPVGFDMALQSVQSGQADGVIAGMSITDDRKKVFDFSEPYFDATVCAAAKSDGDVKSLDDLKGKNVAIKTGTMSADWAESVKDQYGFTVTQFEKSDLMYQDVLAGNSAACFEDTPVMGYAIKTGMNLTMCGVGVEWTLKDGGIKVKRVLPGGPIAKDGRIKPGDVITGVAPKGDGKIKKTDGLSTREVVALFAGKKGEKITLEVRHPDGRVARYTIARDEVPMDDEAASSSVVEIDVAGKRLKAGYLRLPSFYAAAPAGGSKGRSCAEDLRVELEKLKKAGVCGVLFDLRGNNGGSLDDAVKVIGLFVRSGPAVRMRGTGGDITLPVPANSTVCEVPVLVLTSRASASAGELVPATLQDLGRAVVAGDAQTFGKGTAQTVSEFGEGGESAAVVTDGRFYRVTGASTQFKGVESDILLPSVFDDEYYKGERGLKYPLPWDEIEGSDFSASWDLNKFIPELRRASEERLAKNPAWKKHLEKVKWAEECSARKTIPLSVSERKAQFKRDNAVDAAIELQENSGYNPANRKDDVVLDEGLRILADLVRLNGGRVLPQAKAPAGSNVLLGGLDDD